MERHKRFKERHSRSYERRRREPLVGQGAWPPGKKIKRYVPLRCHFLHSEVTVNGNTAPKIIVGSWTDAKRVKMAEKPQKTVKKHAKKTG